MLGTLVRASRAMLGLAGFFTTIYLAYACIFLAPTGRIRRWGLSTWLLLFQSGPKWPFEVVGSDRVIWRQIGDRPEVVGG